MQADNLGMTGGRRQSGGGCNPCWTSHHDVAHDGKSGWALTQIYQHDVIVLVDAKVLVPLDRSPEQACFES